MVGNKESFVPGYDNPTPERPIPCGRYELLERIGYGGMAEVFRARLTGPAGFEKIVVIKRILPNRADDALSIQMFLEEATIAAAADHDNIAQVFELSRADDGKYFIAMEHIAGADLEQLLRAAAKRSLRVPPWFAVYVITEVLEGLEHVHGLTDATGKPRNVIHRDATPSNIFVSRLGTVKLGDFGVADFAGKSPTTRAGQLKGKLTYMSPEQLAGKILDRRSDLFTVGVGLWECLTQHRLFIGNDVQVMLAISDGERKKPSSLAKDIPEELDRVALKALAVDRDQRYQSAAEMHGELWAILERMPPIRRARVRQMYEILLGRRQPNAETTSRPMEAAGRREGGFLLAEGPADARAFDENTAQRRSSVAAGSAEDLETLDEADDPAVAAQAEALRAIIAGRPSEKDLSRGRPVASSRKMRIEPAETEIAKTPLRTAEVRLESEATLWVRAVRETGDGPITYERAMEVLLAAARSGERASVSADGMEWIGVEESLRLIGRDLEPASWSQASNVTVVGSTAERSIVAAFGILARDRHTGTLSVARTRPVTEEWYEIDVAAGRPMRITCNVERMQPANVLVERGLITSSAVPGLVCRAIRERRKVVELAREQSQRAFDRSMLTCARLEALFGWRDADYTFSVHVARVSKDPAICRSLLTPLPDLIERSFSVEQLEALLLPTARVPLEPSWRFRDAIDEMDLRSDQHAAAEKLRSCVSLRDCLETAGHDERRVILAMTYLLKEADVLLERIE
jgi:serine/threonine-protein kinase